MALGFNGRHPRAEEWTKRQAGDLITQIVQDQRQSIRDHLYEAVKSQTPPRQAALEIVGRINRSTGKREGGIIGLTSQQASWVRNMRKELSDPELMPNYFTRKKRDKRFDRLVSKAVEAGKPLSKEDIERLTSRYSDRLLKLRGDTIARTETINALRAGQHEGYVQLVASGKVEDRQIVRTWSSAKDTFTRHHHALMNGQVIIGTARKWTLPDGSLMNYPGDPSLGARPEQIINCRCFELYKIKRS